MASDATEASHDNAPNTVGAPLKEKNPQRTVAITVLLVAFLLFVVTVFMERRTPSSSQATVSAYVVGVAPEVTGRVIEVGVTDNSAVTPGQMLFRLDPEQYRLAVAEAEARLAGVGQSIGASTAAVDVAQARVVEMKAVRVNVQDQATRAMELVRRGVYAQAKYDEAAAALDQADAGVDAAEADLARAREELGPAGKDNPQLKEALAALESAQLDLLRTTVSAPAEGVVTNLQLSVGGMVSAGESAMTFIDTGTIWITAAFKENSLEMVAAGDRAEVLFDILPGQIFAATVEGIGMGVAQGSIDPATGLPKISTDTGWVRTRKVFPSGWFSTKGDLRAFGTVRRRMWSSTLETIRSPMRSAVSGSGFCRSLPMSADRHLLHEADRVNVKRKGLRIALAVAVGFSWLVYSGAIIPFLGPLFAAQFLISSSRPMPLQKALAVTVLILVVGALLQFVTVLTGDRPPVLLLLLGLIYFGCFYQQANGNGGPTIFLVLVIAVMVPLLTILNEDLGDTILMILVQSVVTGMLLMWAAHVLIPDRGTPALKAATATTYPHAARYAAANTAILLIAVVACLTREGLATAIVIPITVVSLLSQFDVAASTRAALGIVITNITGGLAGSVAFGLLQVRPSHIFLFLLVLLAGLVFGGRAAMRAPAAKLYAGALTIFLLVFGTGVSPLPGSAAESFSTRVTYILVAIAYAIFMTTLLWPRQEGSLD